MAPEIIAGATGGLHRLHGGLGGLKLDFSEIEGEKKALILRLTVPKVIWKILVLGTSPSFASLLTCMHEIGGRAAKWGEEKCSLQWCWVRSNKE